MKLILISILTLASINSFANQLAAINAVFFQPESKVIQLINNKQVPAGGTLALCLRASLTATGRGGAKMNCVSRSQIFDVTIKNGLSLIANASFGIDAIYFKNVLPNQESSSCYIGGKLAIAAGVGGEISGMKQLSCEPKSSTVIFDSGIIDGGYLYNIGLSGGAAVDIALERIEVKPSQLDLGFEFIKFLSSISQ